MVRKGNEMFENIEKVLSSRAYRHVAGRSSPTFRKNLPAPFSGRVNEARNKQEGGSCACHVLLFDFLLSLRTWTVKTEAVWSTETVGGFSGLPDIVTHKSVSFKVTEVRNSNPKCSKTD
jgi:hypothetical protein